MLHGEGIKALEQINLTLTNHTYTWEAKAQQQCKYKIKSWRLHVCCTVAKTPKLHPCTLEICKPTGTLKNPRAPQQKTSHIHLRLGMLQTDIGCSHLAMSRCRCHCHCCCCCCFQNHLRTNPPTRRKTSCPSLMMTMSHLRMMSRRLASFCASCCPLPASRRLPPAPCPGAPAAIPPVPKISAYTAAKRAMLTTLHSSPMQHCATPDKPRRHHILRCSSAD